MVLLGLPVRTQAKSRVEKEQTGPAVIGRITGVRRAPRLFCSDTDEDVAADCGPVILVISEVASFWRSLRTLLSCQSQPSCVLVVHHPCLKPRMKQQPQHRHPVGPQLPHVRYSLLSQHSTTHPGTCAQPSKPTAGRAARNTSEIYQLQPKRCDLLLS